MQIKVLIELIFFFDVRIFHHSLVLDLIVSQHFTKRVSGYRQETQQTAAVYYRLNH